MDVHFLWSDGYLHLVSIRTWMDTLVWDCSQRCVIYVVNDDPRRNVRAIQLLAILDNEANSLSSATSVPL
jgi:hypothetical protein